MCTAISFLAGDHYFGRNLDLEHHYDEAVVICPRRFPLPMRLVPALNEHFALIGIAHMEEGFPLYYDAANEHGLCMAGLNFPRHAVYHAPARDADNVTPFELIPWVLGQCASLSEARALLSRMSVVDISFSAALPNTPLHWMLADRTGSLVLESTASGLQVYENPAHAMTNSPPFPYHLQRLCDFMGLSREPAVNRFSDHLPLQAYSRGMGALGLPGDLSSVSRFVRAAFARGNAVCGDAEESRVNHFFRMLAFVAFPRGCVHLGEGQYEITVYSSCCNADKGIYYYTTYENSRVTAVELRRENLDGRQPAVYPLLTQPDFLLQNTPGVQLS